LLPELWTAASRWAAQCRRRQPDERAGGAAKSPTRIGRTHLNGETNIADARRRFAAQPWAALALIGIERRIE
jgi:hypothetical protein